MTTPDNDRTPTDQVPDRTAYSDEGERTYADDQARTTGLGEDDRSGSLDEGDRSGGLGEGDRSGGLGEGDRSGGLGEGDRSGGLGEGDRSGGLGEGDPAYADGSDRAGYGNADGVDDGDRVTSGSDALDRPAAGSEDNTLDDRDGQTADSARAVDGDKSAEPTVSPEDPLVPDDIAVDFKARWDVIQQGFVDDPRIAVTDADKLVGDVLQRLSSTFDQQHQSLEGQWADGEPSTEDLRGALQRYRAFFDRLLTL